MSISDGANICLSLSAGGVAWGASASLTEGTRAPLLGGGLDNLMAVLKVGRCRLNR